MEPARTGIRHISIREILLKLSAPHEKKSWVGKLKIPAKQSINMINIGIEKLDLKIEAESAEKNQTWSNLRGMIALQSKSCLPCSKNRRE